MKRAAVAKIGSMDRQTLRDGVHRFIASTLQRFDNRMEMQQRDRRVRPLWKCGLLTFWFRPSAEI
jgi:hypothetical protein